MAGLDPAIHVLMRGTKDVVDARHKAGRGLASKAAAKKV